MPLTAWKHTAHGSYEWTIMLEKCGRLDLTVFHLIYLKNWLKWAEIGSAV